MRSIPVLACKACKKRTRDEWWAGSLQAGRELPANVNGVCPDFVRYHHHLDGVCAKWAGLLRENPLLCPNCGSSLMRPMTIVGTKSDEPCGDKCLTAQGPACSCSCGGENHGIYAHGKN